MKLRSLQEYEIRARVARALGHPTRLLLLDALRRKELCVGELTSLVGADQSTVSRHLGVLREAGLVEVRRAGATSRFRLICPCLEGFFSCIESVIAGNLARQKSVVGE